MFKRRAFLAKVSLIGACVISGCANFSTASTEVDVIIRNNTSAEHTLFITVNKNSEQVFQTEKTVPASSSEDLVEESVPAAFEGSEGDKFSVNIQIGEYTRTFDYEITCADEELTDAFAVYIFNDQGGQTGPVIEFRDNHCSD